MPILRFIQITRGVILNTLKIKLNLIVKFSGALK